jgi:photosystem II stability/assembly factor-like uncharacterized protein
MTRSLRRSALFLLLLPLLTAPLAAFQWVPLGPFGGSIKQIVIDPSDGRVAYATLILYNTDREILFKTTDGGGQWGPILDSGGDLAMDPARHATLYLATREDRRLLKSVNGGASWFETGPRSGPDRLAISAVTVDPARASRVYVVASSGVWRSTDRGASWKPTGSSPRVIGRLIAASQPAGTVFAVTDTGLSKSSDAGETWRSLPTPGETQTVGLFAVVSQRLYASFGESLFRSTDGGATWRPALPRTIGGSASSLAVSPRAPRTLWLGTAGGLLRSTDAGDTWTATGLGQPVAAVAIAASSPGTVYAGLQKAWSDADVGGISVTTNGGGTWTRRNRGLTGLDVATLAVDPSDPDILWIVHRWALYRSANAGARWARTALPVPSPPQPFPLYDIVIDPVAPSTVYTLSSALWRTQDGGQSWTNLSATGAPALGSLLIEPGSSAQLWGFGAGWLYTSADAGDHWSRLHLPNPGCGLSSFALAPSSSPILYAAGSQGYPGDYCIDTASPAFFRSTDGGVTWTNTSGGFHSTIFDAAGPIAVDPVDPRLIYVGTDAWTRYSGCDGVWKSTDGGTTWAQAGRALGCVYAVAASPAAGVVWAGTDDGRIFRSGDFGATWKRRALGLLTDRIYRLVISPADPQRVYAATSSGVWMWDETP